MNFGGNEHSMGLLCNFLLATFSLSMGDTGIQIFECLLILNSTLQFYFKSCTFSQSTPGKEFTVTGGNRRKAFTSTIPVLKKNGFCYASEIPVRRSEDIVCSFMAIFRLILNLTGEDPDISNLPFLESTDIEKKHDITRGFGEQYQDIRISCLEYTDIIPNVLQY
jgi:hypothetical protein